MKVALVNKNPAVSRLITLSLNKIGVTYSEFADASELEGSFDFLIIDSDAQNGELNLKDFAPKIMYLAPRGETQPEFADILLLKPFLPTDFIDIFEQQMESKDADLSDDNLALDDAGLGFDDSFADALPTLDDFETLDELPSLDEDLNLKLDEPRQDLAEQDELLNLEELPSENLEDLGDDLKADDLGEEVLNLDELPADLDADLGDLDEPNLKEDLGDDLADEILNLDELPSENLEAEDLSQEAPLEDLAQEDDQNDIIQNIKHILDDIDTQDEALKGDLPSGILNLDELSSENLEDLNELNLKEDLGDDLADEILNLDELPADLADEDLNLKTHKEADLADEVLNLDELPAEIEDEKMKEISQIDDIDEAAMLAAFGQISQVAQPKVQDDFRAQLSKQISDQITASLSEGALKEALKDMNIKISISFEEK